MQKKHLTKFNILSGKHSQQIGVGGVYLNIIKAICDKSTVSIILSNPKNKG